ncbi:alkaline shock response membrane anchor protein AmaP [Kibdelosporangium philippinense]|uniref:Alkaline shock response membrane anchor protein AmaP n=1 Tax=Kibdelosporangium philippinense TaxID=211113 RepID=A0ABS8ZF75_9PSEU|nr:alkaline shock response membrane anchor protein AmaP [Kibdelosporangium philippinense]MCE7006097.1 alkaline shock response membrane anchor protein AmaP [Kibdelosporangium philippinense]
MGSRNKFRPPLMWTTVVGLAVGVPAAIWGFIPFDPFDPTLEYAWRPDMDPAVRTWIGIVGLAVALVLVVSAILVLIMGKADRRWGEPGGAPDDRFRCCHRIRGSDRDNRRHRRGYRRRTVDVPRWLGRAACCST